jgi:hypothetical protein
LQQYRSSIFLKKIRPHIKNFGIDRKDTKRGYELDNIAVKGKKEGVRIYTIGETRKEGHQEFLNLYYSGDWKKAIFVATTLLNDDTVTIKSYYENMIERLNEGKPDNWDGTFRATSK